MRQKKTDYAKILGDAKVLCLGDDHIDLNFKSEILRDISELKDAGISHLAMELITVKTQPLLDEYFRLAQSNQADSNEASDIRQLISNWFYRAWGGEPDPASLNEELLRVANLFTDMLTTAASMGIRGIAIEPHLPYIFSEDEGIFLLAPGIKVLKERGGPRAKYAFENLWQAEKGSSEEESACTTLADILYNDKVDDSWSGEKCQGFFNALAAFHSSDSQLNAQETFEDFDGQVADWRERSWLTAVAETLELPESKMAIFAGANHFKNVESENFRRVLTRMGYKTAVLQYDGQTF